jgi:hypothetical protein
MTGSRIETCLQRVTLDDPNVDQVGLSHLLGYKLDRLRQHVNRQQMSLIANQPGCWQREVTRAAAHFQDILPG